MPVAEATTIVPPQQACHLETYDPAADRIALEKLAVWCHRFSPRVGLEEGDSPETLLLDVAGVAPLFGGESALVEQVAGNFRRLQLDARIARERRDGV